MVAHRCPVFWLTAACFVGTVGCGGMDQTDMRKYALKRPKDDDEPKSLPAAAIQKADQLKQQVSQQTIENLTAEPRSASPTVAQVPAVQTEALTEPPAVVDRAVPSGATVTGDTRAGTPSANVVQRRQETIDNLTKLAAAFEAYLKEHGTYPTSVLSSAREPLLSWRVALLPYLGYGTLYQSFHLDESWDSAHNQTLIQQIPAVYQSPERLDTKTNYLVPIGTSTAFQSNRIRPPRLWDDDVTKTIILIEADERFAVTWTEPKDFEYQSQKPRLGLSDLRPDGFFAVLGAGKLCQIPSSVPDKSLRGLFTIDGGESISLASLTRDARPELATAEDLAVAGSPVTTTQAPPAFQTAPEGVSPNPASASPDPLPATSPSSGTMLQASIQTFHEGRETDAMRLLLAAMLTETPQLANEYRWIPALRRPSLAVRYGVGIDYTGPNYDKLTPLQGLAREQNSWSVAAGKLRGLADDMGDRVVEILGRCEPWLPPMFANESVAAPKSKPLHQRQKRGMEFVGAGKTTELIEVSQNELLDVLFVLQVSESNNRQNNTVKEVRLVAVDVMAGRNLLEGESISLLRREHQLKTSLLAEDPIDDLGNELSMLIESLEPQPIPSALREHHAVKRATTLAQIGRREPLRCLSEIKLYHLRQLLDASETLSAYEAILGNSTALELLGGQNNQKRDAIAKWVPRATSRLD